MAERCRAVTASDDESVLLGTTSKDKFDLYIIGPDRLLRSLIGLKYNLSGLDLSYKAPVIAHRITMRVVLVGSVLGVQTLVG